MSRRAARRDRDVAALLAARAFVEIRALASGGGDVEHIRFLADLCHNLPGVARPPRRRPTRRGDRGSVRERAMDARPMSWTWNTAGPKGQAWMLRQIEDAGEVWTPPPPLPEHPGGAARLTPPQRVGVLLRRWPVRAPVGRRPLPRAALVVKALDTDAVCAVHEEAAGLRLGLGAGAAFLREHLHPGGVHYLVPDPADYYWPGNADGAGGTIRWWQCGVLLLMADGEQVSGSVAVLPETFMALPAPRLSRAEQVRLVHLLRATERDTYLWGRGRQFNS